MAKQEDWLSITDASRLVGYHPDSVREWAMAGKVKARKVVTVWQVDRSSLLAYVRQAQEHGEKRGRKKKIDKH